MTACNKKRNLQYFNQQSAEGPEEYTHYNQQRDLRKTHFNQQRDLKNTLISNHAEGPEKDNHLNQQRDLIFKQQR
jgi:hypothetical protein